jgi:hypothetical protein
MDWQIELPHYGDRDDLILEVISAAREEFGEDDQRTRVAEVIVNDAFFNRGVTSVGQLIDGFNALDQAGARARLDWARGELGLPSTAEVEKRRADAKFEAEARRLEPPPPPRWNPLQRCPECGTFPGEGGSWKPVNCERWWCDAHKHLAAEGDLEEHVPAIIGLTSSGAPVYSPKERRRRAEWLKKQKDDQERERRQREAHDQAVAETIEEAKQHYIDHGEISIMGVRARPDGRIIQ